MLTLADPLDAFGDDDVAGPVLDFGRAVCGDLAAAESREWLVTNGIGGFASGTLAGLLTRRYHGLLVAALAPPLGRTLLVSKLDEIATYGGQQFALGANRWAGGAIDPKGFRYLERFHLDGTTAVWTFACSDALLEKRLWMQHGANTTYVRYAMVRGTAPLALEVKALVNYRDYHGDTHAGDWQMRVEPVADGLSISAFDGATPFYLLSDRAEATPQHEWYRDYLLCAESERGLADREDHLYAGLFHVTLQPGASVTLVASTAPDASLDGATAEAARQSYERGLIAGALGGQRPVPAAPERHTPSTEAPDKHEVLAGSSEEHSGASEEHVPAAGASHEHVSAAGASDKPGLTDDGGYGAAPSWLRHLVLAADQFVVQRALPGEPDGKTVIAGYPWFGDWGRDTMIALPGLTLTTGRPQVARTILRTFARCVDRGMLPNRFPDAGATPEYNTVDATLWYLEAIRAYHAASGDDELLRELFPTLREIVDWHRRGTRYNIHVDPADGLLYAGAEGVQLTWMDAKVGDQVITPRTGKPVEVNALWYNGLRAMAAFAAIVGADAAPYDELADQAKAGFARFWNKDRACCYDVIDGPHGHDAALRPNQLLAVSLPHSPLPPERQRAVMEVCARHLQTSHGLRSLAPGEQGYAGEYGGDVRQRDSAYHQGTVWAWLIGPFVAAHLRVYGDRALARSFLWPLVRQIDAYGMGSIGEIFDGDAPFAPRGCIAQAWSVAELLRAWQLTSAVE